GGEGPGTEPQPVARTTDPAIAITLPDRPRRWPTADGSYARSVRICLDTPKTEGLYPRRTADAHAPNPSRRRERRNGHDHGPHPCSQNGRSSSGSHRDGGEPWCR